MSDRALQILSSGLVTSVGLSATASCAAIRAKLRAPTETRFIDSEGAWILAHQVTLPQPWRGRARLAKMAAMTIAECLEGIEPDAWADIALLLCVAEPERPGRAHGLDDELLADIEKALGACFHRRSAVLAHGRVGVAVALMQARTLLYQEGVGRVIVAAADSLVGWRTLSAYERADRLLTESNSDGFLAGEAASAVLIGKPQQDDGLCCIGVGFGVERATVLSGEPLKGEGLADAIKASLLDAGRDESEMSFKICDLSGEQYGFKEASLAFSRVDRTIRTGFEIWHPAECVGETGAAIGPLMLAVLHAASLKGYLKGNCILAHMSADEGARAAMILQSSHAGGSH
ncbi:hypothetical protein QCE47_17545 [Caballeronia sp. LZ025]|uniref:hypothetical protein n=1 Tax=Caballeronia TaxID=1827195 RepID=UPI001FD4F1D6|nr:MULTISPECIES: hypothetical protein [Caballeronia]MDR5734115.1 hypothetical protein [Caballeronia sp. LZ025]